MNKGGNRTVFRLPFVFVLYAIPTKINDPEVCI